MTIALQFLGAARQATGTKHLLQDNTERLLLDCGELHVPSKYDRDGLR